MYSLRKFLKLAIAGNPTVLLPLFAPAASVRDIGDVIAEIDAVRTRILGLLESGATPLPTEADTDRISAWSVDAHRRHWREHDGL